MFKCLIIPPAGSIIRAPNIFAGVARTTARDCEYFGFQ